jgi:indolepyruvate ferredoxin oxidoreductase beta subunit
MKDARLLHDPYNVIITGVGGQGNIMASRVVGNILCRKGLNTIIGETFGASQRGGSVTSHLRISAESHGSPQIPKGRCHLVIALEPTEAIRVLTHYGNPNVRVLCNTRPVHAIGVISGEQPYPPMEKLKAWIAELSEDCWFLAATDQALELGNPILGNIVLIGAAAGLGVLPIDKEDFEASISASLSSDVLALNLKAYDLGVRLVQ